MTINAIFFDLGNVLVTFDWNLAIPRYAAHNGGDSDRIKTFLAHPYHDAFERNEFGGKEFFARGRELTGFQATQPEFETYWNEIFTEIPENVRLLRRLAASYPIFALSNTNPWHAAYLERTFDWMRLFKTRFYSFTLGARKPDPKIFRGALERAGVLPDSVLYIDDRLENVETARDLGMQTIYLASPELLKAAIEPFALVPEPL